MEANYALEYFTTANTVTGFYFAQSILFLFALIKDDDFRVLIHRNLKLAVFATVAIGTIYVVIILLLAAAEYDMLNLHFLQENTFITVQNDLKLNVVLGAVIRTLLIVAFIVLSVFWLTKRLPKSIKTSSTKQNKKFRRSQR